MRAKVRVISVEIFEKYEQLKFRAVSNDEIPTDDDKFPFDTRSKWIPQAELNITVTNPALIGKFRPGERYYVDFTKAE